ncbi:MAG: lysine biosynthesis protein LysX [Candidatus Freyarchaeota archaeon]|nr:lysine biosynthesis protein LysX [Candidatus Jordarchaeia archaeon]
MILGIIHNRIAWEEKELIETAKRKGVNVKIFDNRNLEVDVTGDGCDYGVDIFLQRSISYTKGLYSTLVLEEMGYRVVNSSKCQEVCGDKLKTTLALKKAGLPLPKTHLALSCDAAMKALEKLSYPSVAKPLIGSWGRLVAILNDPASAKAILETREALGDTIHKVYYLQEYVNHNSRDLRVFIVGDEAVAAMYRYTIPGDWRSNATIGGKAEVCHITDEIEEMALRAARATFSEIAGVDLLEGNEGILLNEVNHNPGFQHISAVTKVDIAGKIIYYLKETYKN